MAIALSFRYPCHSHLGLASPRFRCFPLPHVQFSCAAAVQAVDEPQKLPIVSLNLDLREEEGGSKDPKWKRFNSKELGIKESMIAKPARVVLKALKRKGFDVYLAGGCVRDLILKRTPKDFDVLTTAELKEVKRTFEGCLIVGRRFPICHVQIGDDLVEVSSFSTSSRNRSRKLNLAIQRHVGCNEKDHSRWRNCMQRDLTINGLLYDPYRNTVYDYTGGVEDIRKAKVRTVNPASLSFKEDRARILRAIRIAARLGFGFSKDTAIALKDLASSVLFLDKGRHFMEMNYMLAYGSAESSLRLLWRFGLLELLLPIQAAYFVRCGFKRRDKRSNLLLSLFSNLDKLLAPDRPCHSRLWVAILAFHKALSDRPRDPLVIAAFSIAVHNGGDMAEALSIARSISIPHDTSYHELLETQKLEHKVLRKEVLDLGASVNQALNDMTDESYVSQAMSAYPKAPSSNLVFISLDLHMTAGKIVECVNNGKHVGFVPKQDSNIDYKLLAMGGLQEVRHVFARVIFDTVYPLHLGRDQ